MESTSVLTTILTAIGSIVSGAVSWISSFLELITDEGNELLLIVVVMPFVGLGIGLLKRLMSTRA